MNILFCSTNSPYGSEVSNITKKIGGAEVSLRLIAEGLADRKHKIYYLSKRRGLSTVKKPINGVSTVHFSPLNFPKWRAISSWYYQRELEKKFEYYSLRLKIDLIFTYATFPDTYYAAKVGKRHNIPVVQRIGGRHWNNLLKEKKKYYEKIYFSFQNISCSIYVSHYMQRITEEQLKENSLPLPLKKAVLDIGTNIKKFRTKKFMQEKKKQRTNNAVTILFIGAFKECSKRQDVLLRALSLLSTELKDVEILFVGSGPTLKDCQFLASELGVEDRVTFLGDVPHFKISQILGKTDILALPTEFEGSPKSVIEAMAAGVPVIASDIPSIREIIKDGETGYIAKNDPEDFAAKIRLLLGDSGLRARVGSRARRYAESNFDHQKNIISIERLLSEVIEESRDV